MLVFYPDFDINSSSSSDEVILLLDTSESMKGESLSMAQTTALQVLKTLDHNLKLNIILFGTGRFELHFLSHKDKTSNITEAQVGKVKEEEELSLSIEI